MDQRISVNAQSQHQTANKHFLLCFDFLLHIALSMTSQYIVVTDHMTQKERNPC